MTSGVVGMRSHVSALREHPLGLNGITGDTNQMVFNLEDKKTRAVQLLEQLEPLMNEVCDLKSSHKQIAKVCHYLKSEGSRLDDDSSFRQQLDVYFDLLRNILRKPKLSPFARTLILEVIELRASNWSSNEDIEEYYRRKMTEFEANDSYSSANDLGSELQKSQSFVATNTGTDVLKSTPKHNKANKMSGKTFLRDEVLIRNGDSGKVTAGAKERLVQITGSSEESIERAKELIETTIKRNASPDPFESQNRSFESSFSQKPTEVTKTVSPVLESPPVIRSETTAMATPPPLPQLDPKNSHSFTVEVNNDVILLSTNNYELGLKAQQLLKEWLQYSSKPLHAVQQKDQICEKRHSISDSNSGDDFDNKPIPTAEAKKEIMAALDSATKVVPTQHNRIQRSSSQGTVPIGRTSLRFMSKSVGHESTTKLITYERQFLMECSALPSSKCIENMEVMAKIFKKTPEIIRKHQNSGDNTSSSSAPSAPLPPALYKSKSFTQGKEITGKAITVDDWV